MTKEQMEQIVSENMKKIYLYCVRRLGNASDAEDVASDIMLELLRSYSEVRDDAAVHSYMWSVAGNLCKSFWRKAGKTATMEIPEDYAGTYMITPEEKLIHEEELMTLRRELSLLSEKYRKVMIAHYIQQKTCEEIAGEMGLTVTNVKQYLFEGRKKSGKEWTCKENMEYIVTPRKSSQWISGAIREKVTGRCSTANCREASCFRSMTRRRRWRNSAWRSVFRCRTSRRRWPAFWSMSSW